MNAYETIDLLHAIGSRLDVQWGFFVSIHLALLGGIIYVDRPLRVTEKVTAVAVYLGFAYLNYTITKAQSNQLYAAYRQLEDLAAERGDKAQALLEYFGASSATNAYGVYSDTVIAVHGVMAVIVVASIILDRPRPAKDSRENPAG